jgi:hypothetical protein
VLADKPLGYWPLNESSSERNVHDRSGNGFNGVAMRQVRLGEAGPFGDPSRAAAFNGNAYIDVGRHSEFAMKNNFAVEAWAWIGQVAPTSYIISALGQDPKQDEFYGWGLIAGHDSTPVGNNKNPMDLYLNIQQVGHFNFMLSPAESVQNRWNHLVVVFDETNTAQLYLNGTHRGSVSKGLPSIVGPVWIQIGCAQMIDTDFWRGRIAHVAVYSHMLTEQKVREHFILGSRPTSQPLKSGE